MKKRGMDVTSPSIDESYLNETKSFEKGKEGLENEKLGKHLIRMKKKINICSEEQSDIGLLSG